MKIENQFSKQKRLRRNFRRDVRAKIRKDIKSGSLRRVPQQFRGSVKFNCPDILSLEKNFGNTIAFFCELKDLARHIVDRRRYRPTTAVIYSIGLNNLSHISVRCAVILAAEIDRLRLIAGNRLIYRGTPSQENDAITLLRQIGLFDLIGGVHAARGTTRDVPGHKTAIPLMAGSHWNLPDFEQFNEAVRTIFDEYQSTEFVYCGLTEAMLNATDHAYTKKGTLQLKYPIASKQWWAAAVMDTELEELRVMIYDQGHGIAATLPFSDVKEQVKVNVAKLIGLFSSWTASGEEILVSAALQLKRTSTGEIGRGKGFGDIMEPIQVVADSRLRITSGKAEVTIKRGCATVSSQLAAHIGGTLIEWTFPVQMLRREILEAG